MPAKPDQTPRMASADATARRKGVLRTAAIVAAIAVAIYVAFILAGVAGT